MDEADLTQHSWYKPDLSRTGVVQLLRGKKAGAFCVRESASQPGCYALSVSVSPQADKLWTGLITPTGSQFRLFVKQKFDHIPAGHSSYFGGSTGALARKPRDVLGNVPADDVTPTCSSSYSTPSRPITSIASPRTDISRLVAPNIKCKEKEKEVSFEEDLREHEEILQQRQEAQGHGGCRVKTGARQQRLRPPAAPSGPAWTPNGRAQIAPTLCASSQGTQEKDIVYELVEDEVRDIW